MLGSVLVFNISSISMDNLVTFICDGFTVTENGIAFDHFYMEAAMSAHLP